MNAALIAILDTWPQMLLGLVLIVPGVGVGWHLGAATQNWLVRLIVWWLSCVILPKLRLSGWIARTAVIFLNNATVLAIILLSGFFLPTSVLAIVFVSVGMGIGMRRLTEDKQFGEQHVDEPSTAEPGDVAQEGDGEKEGEVLREVTAWKVRAGMLLNLIEPPVILAAVGLSLSQATTNLQPNVTWHAFAVWLIPLLLLAAGGESLWLGEVEFPPDDPG